MAWSVSQWLKAGMIGIGSILCVVPGIGPVVGGSIIAGGIGIPTSAKGTPDTVDPVSAAYNNVIGGWTNATTGVYNQTPVMDNAMAWIKKNILIVAGAGGLLLYLIFKKK